ncbi:unnamed protein product [Trichobilharzia regenti]|nr:unnamed protein product [Trichobilharzia regenti]
MSGPEPVKEDPAYLTVLLLVLNAEPNVPGMQAKFPRHIYLQELLPSLLPKTPVDDGFQDYSPTVIPNKVSSFVSFHLHNLTFIHLYQRALEMFDE